MKLPFTRQCDECHNFKYISGPCMSPICTKGHKPRFYMPRWATDDGCGFKRRCLDFAAISDANRKGGG